MGWWVKLWCIHYVRHAMVRLIENRIFGTLWGRRRFIVLKDWWQCFSYVLFQEDFYWLLLQMLRIRTYERWGWIVLSGQWESTEIAPSTLLSIWPFYLRSLCMILVYDPYVWYLRIYVLFQGDFPLRSILLTPSDQIHRIIFITRDSKAEQMGQMKRPSYVYS